jgi:hypothetical protein
MPRKAANAVRGRRSTSLDVLTCVLLAVLGGTTQSSVANVARASMRVSVTIPRQASIVAASYPSCLMPGDPDAARDGIRVRAEYVIRSTSSVGIELVIQPLMQIESIAVAIPGRTDLQPLPGSGASFALPDYPTGETRIAIDYRFEIDGAANSDCIPWPVQVDARSL